MKGRKPVPSHLKVVRGNPGKRALNKNEPLPTGDLFDAPAWMTESQKQNWSYAIENAPKGLLKKLDRSVLVAWAIAEDLHRRASEMVEKFGILTKAPNGSHLDQIWSFVGDPMDHDLRYRRIHARQTGPDGIDDRASDTHVPGLKATATVKAEGPVTVAKPVTFQAAGDAPEI